MELMLYQERARELERDWKLMCNGEPEAAEPMHLPVAFGRELIVKRSCPSQRLIRVMFEELCCKGIDGTAYGSPDYLALVSSCSALFLEEIPCLRRRQRDEAKRLVLLVDSLYEQRTNVRCRLIELAVDVDLDGDCICRYMLPSQRRMRQ